MVTSLLDLGIQSLDHLAASAKRRQSAAKTPLHPLAAYPSLHALLIQAERSGTLDAERRRLMHRRLAA